MRVELGWKRLCLGSRALGYLPADKLGIGSDIETHDSLMASIRWVGTGAWIDPRDGFDYGLAAQQCAFPPSLWLTGAADTLLGHPQDVKRFMGECGVNESSFILLGRGSGALHDYDHIDLLTHEHAPQDHFPRVSAWLNDVMNARLSEFIHSGQGDDVIDRFMEHTGAGAADLWRDVSLLEPGAIAAVSARRIGVIQPISMSYVHGHDLREGIR